MKRFAQLLPAVLFILGLYLSCDSSTVRGPAGAGLKLQKPVDQTLERGRTNDVSVLIQREGFTGPVALELSQLPAGVNVTSSKLEIPGAGKSATVTLHADPQAALVANHRVLVTAKALGLEVSEGFNLTVKE